MKVTEYWMLLCLSICMCTTTLHDRFEECHRDYHSCLSGPKNIYCRCDDLCTSYDDCCFDVNYETREKTEHYKDHYQFLNRTSCEDIYFSQRNIIQPSVFMVSSCPAVPSMDEKLRALCEGNASSTVLDLLPVTVSDTGVTFKNRHCAKCNGQQKWIPWLLNTSCSPVYFDFNRPSLSFSEEVMLRVLNVDCNYNFEPPQAVKVRYCYRLFKYNVYQSLEWIDETLCGDRIFKPFAYNNKDYHRNSQCLFDALGKNISAEGRCFIQPSDGNLASEYVFTLTSLIDISALLQSSSGIAKCGNSEIHLSDKTGCQRLYCPHDMEPRGGRCVEVRHTENGILLDVLFQVDFALSYSRSYLFNGINPLLHKVLSRLNDCIIYIPNSVNVIFSSYEIYQGYNFVINKVCAMLKIRYPMKEKPNNRCTMEYKRQVVHDVVTNFLDAYHNDYTSFPKRFVREVDNSSCQCNVSLSNPMYLLNQYQSTNTLTCPAVKVDFFHANESSANDINGNMSDTIGVDLYFAINGTVIESSDVLSMNGQFFVCIDTFKLKYQDDTHSYTIHYRTIINTACTCISMLCLTYSMVQYCVLPFLRNRKSDLILVLIAFLFLAQTCFLLTSYLTFVHEFCEWLGMLHHFAWLGCFIFMFLCSFRLNAEMRDLKSYSKLDHTLRTLKYSVVGLCCNVAIVLCTKLTNLYLAPLEKWYGGQLCFISEAYVLICTFIIPFLLILCGNTALFVSMIIYINKTSQRSMSQSFKPKLVVFIKISTIMGFIWIVGFIAVMVESEVLSIIFENVASLQGMFITVSFTCNHRVWNYYKSRQQERSRPSKTTSSAQK